MQLTPDHAKEKLEPVVTNYFASSTEALGMLLQVVARLLGNRALHRKGALVTDPAARSGPEIEFQMFPPQSGFVRLFAQVQVGGVSKYAPFGLRVSP